jgi:hypothetical protein
MKKIVCFFILLFITLAVSAQKEQNLMSGKYSPQELQNKLIPRSQWTPFPRIDDRTGWARADRNMLTATIEAAGQYLDYDWPVMPATLSLLIVRTGNRSEYEAVSFKKRNVLGTIVMAEIAENKGRFVDQIVNGVWAICEESWWGVSAHLPNTKDISGLMDVSDPFVDLFAAETGALLAWTDYFLGDKFEAISPQIRKRIYNEVNYRLMEPLMKKHHGWMTGSDDGLGPNNWNPWICSNWITFVLLLEKDQTRRATMVGKALKVLDEFINPYPQDGGCDEGPGYWGRAAASLYDNIDMLNLASRGAFRYVYENERVRNMGRFIYRAQIGEDYFLNFADASPKIGVSSGLVYRFGKDIQDQDMMDFGAYYHRPNPRGAGTALRSLSELFIQDELLNATKRLPYPKDVWLPDLQVAIARDQAGTSNGFYIAAKGGHNAESHNHNDIGNFVVFYDGLPLLIDVGSGTYTHRTFNGDRRYEIWFNCSDYHNTPTINGATQKAGMAYCASDVSYKSGKPAVEFSLDIAKAYPAETGINSWKRTVVLNHGKSVQVKDITNLQKASSVTQHLMTCYPAEIKKPGELLIHFQTADKKTIDFVVKYNAQQMTARVEKVKLGMEEDQGVLSKWGDNIYQINFDVTAPKLKDSYVFEIKKK